MRPAEGALDLTGLEIATDSLNQAMAVEPKDWAAEFESQQEFFAKLGASVPAKIEELRETLRAGLGIQ
jgi:phosphoenolpyruvate carboxykinase (GTP)